MSRPITPVASPTQLPTDYARQLYTNQARGEADLQRDIDRDRLAERGRALAGFVQRDRRPEGLGFVFERQQAATWPAQMPAPAIAAVETAITAEGTSRAALRGAEMQYQLWAQSHASASDARRTAKYEELTEDLLPAAQKAAQQLEQVLARAAQVVETIEQWRHVEDTAEGRRAAAEKAYQAALNAVDTELMVVRQAVQRVGVQV